MVGQAVTPVSGWDRHKTDRITWTQSERFLVARNGQRLVEQRKGCPANQIPSTRGRDRINRCEFSSDGDRARRDSRAW